MAVIQNYSEIKTLPQMLKTFRLNIALEDGIPNRIFIPYLFVIITLV
jgi:hypothetical protein